MQYRVLDYDAAVGYDLSRRTDLMGYRISPFNNYNGVKLGANF